MKLSAMVDVSEVLKNFDLRHKQVRYAAARALTDMAKLSQEGVKDRLQKYFTLRRNWVLQGIRIKPATRGDLTAAVFSKDHYMGLQETGGDKVPRGKHIAVPGPVLRPGKKSSESKNKIPESEWPASAMAKARTFMTKTKKGALVIMRRVKGTEPGLPRKAQGRLARALFGKRYTKLKARRGRRLIRSARIVHTLVGRAHVPPRLGMFPLVKLLVREEFGRRFLVHWEEAKRTARQ